MIKSFPSDANIATTAKERKNTCEVSKNPKKAFLLRLFLLFTIVLAKTAKVKGITNTIIILSASVPKSTLPDLPKNSKRYTGKSNTYKIKFVGRIAVDKGTFPFATLVKTKYQSVQGVTISMTNPIQIAISLFKNILPNR